MKYIIFIKSLYTYTKNSLISFLSFLIIKLIPKKNILKLITSLENKNVLVLGTGPSLDKLNQKLIDEYDIIFFLNNAINVSKIFNFEKKKKIFFNSDLFRFKQLKKNISTLDNSWIYVFIPIHLQLFLSFIYFYFNRNAYLLVPKYRIGFPFEKNVTKSFITYCLAGNYETKNKLNINNFKAFPHTVALNAFYFLISSRVNKLHYLGCDFSSGKSSYTQYKGAGNLKNKKVYLWVNKLKKLSKYYSIDFKDLK